MTDEQLVSQLARRFAVEVEQSGDPTEVTATAAASTDNITKTAHGLLVGQAVTFSGTPAAPLVAATTYYVVAATTNTFKVSATLGGTAVDITADGDADYVEGAGWVKVRAVNSFKRVRDNKMEDDSDFDSEGWTSEMKTGMGWGIELGLITKYGIVTREEDPGQKILRLASDEFGPDSVVHVRYYDREGGPEAYEGYASVSWEPEDGGVTDLDKAKVKLSGQGKRTAIENPAAP
jgi:hypothetical protein